MTMETHVKKICQSSYFQIRNIRSIRKLLSDDSAASLIYSFVTSRLDNGNCLLNGISDALLKKLQLVQNTAARVLTKTRKYDHITPVLKDLHWLPVRERIQYKILLLTWKSLHDVAPPYLKDLLIPYTPARDLRSSDKELISVPRVKTSYGDRAFSSAAPTLWNTLPIELRKSHSIEHF